MEELKKGFKCKCGREEKYGMYVMAHWDIRLQFTCPACQRRYEILHGKAKEIK